MKNILFLIFLVTPFLGYSQTDSVEKKEYLYPAENTVEETMPYYPDGDAARMKFILKNLEYPKTAVKEKKQGKVYVKFIVKTDGTLGKVHTIKSFDDACGEEAVRVVKMMKWIPGTQGGKPINVWVVMPVMFKLK